ncbi:hypothetical protein B0J17DRAFT_215712 [Rhizoctonia solani]|nr:hypothetical protein B0J17DRAFT_215712 [Rhizoctonia solani]
MNLRSSNSKRKRHNLATSGDQLHPGEWRGGKKSRPVSRSRSPSASGASTPGTSGSNYRTRSRSVLRDPPHSRGSPHPHESTAQAFSGPTPPIPSQTPCNATINPTSSSLNSESAAWAGLGQALQTLRITAKTCPPLRSAIDDLVSCLSLFEAAAKSRNDYEDLANGLKNMVGMLSHHLVDATSERITNTLAGISEYVQLVGLTPHSQ